MGNAVWILVERTDNSSKAYTIHAVYDSRQAAEHHQRKLLTNNLEVQRWQVNQKPLMSLGMYSGPMSLALLLD
jgi:hypothetical protein